MLQIQKGFYPALLVSLLIAHGTTIDSRAAEPAPPPTQPTVPWTQEKYKPPEVEEKDKKNDQPVATCEKQGKDGRKYHQVTYSDGTVVKYWPDGSDNWEIKKPGPNGVTKITYSHLTGSGISGFSGAKSVQEPGKAAAHADPNTDPGAKKWKEDMEKKSAEEAKKKSDLTPRFAPPVRQASLPAPWFQNWLVNVGYYGSIGSLPSLILGTGVTDTAAPIQFAATVEKQKPTPKTEAKDKPQEKPPPTQAHVVINLKVVTYGGPTPGVTIHFEPDDPRTPKPDDFAKTDKPQNTWKPDDVPGPRTTPGPKPGGFIPVDPKDQGGGGYVNIGGGWAYVRIPISFFQSCASDDDDSDDGPGASSDPKKPSSAPQAGPKQQSSAPSEPQEPRRETIEQRQAREWDQGPQPTAQQPPVEYNPVGETAYIKGVREDAANSRAKIARLTQERYDSCAPDDWWDWVHGNPIWKEDNILMRRQWMIEIYEEAYLRARGNGLDNLAAHAYGQIKLDEWRQEAVDQFVNTMIEHLQNYSGAITGIQAMKAAAQYGEEFLKAKDILRKKEIMQKAIKQAKAAQAAQATAQAPKNPKLTQGGVHQALSPQGQGSGTQRYGPGEGPRPTAPKPQTAARPKPQTAVTCPRPTDPKKAQELKQLEAKIDAKAKKTDELAAKLTQNRAGEKDPDYFKENPGTKLTQQQRERMEVEFDKLMGENIKDLSKAIQIRNEIYPKATGGPSSITPQEAQALLTRPKPLMGADKGATLGSESPTGVFGPGGTQQLPRTGPGQTQPLRGPGDTLVLPK